MAAVVMVRLALTGSTAIAACLLAGLLVGCVNAALIVWLNVPPLLAALGTMFTVQGLKRWMVDGQTLITGLTLPISLLGTLAASWTVGFSINMMTLLALALCIGLLIDDAIVVRENIVRHVGMGKHHRQAALDGLALMLKG